MTTQATSLPLKGKAVPLVRSKKQIEKVAAAALGAEQAEASEQAQTLAQEAATRLAQIVNLHLAGHSLAQIGLAIGATAEEVDRMLATDAARYVRSQPSLRIYVRNYISGKYTSLLDAVWTEATDRNHAEKLENQDRALRILKEMGRLHGAEAPTQAEVTVDAAPDAVEKMVAALSAQRGQGYDVDIFDAEVISEETVHAGPAAALARLERASADVEKPMEGESL